MSEEHDIPVDHLKDNVLLLAVDLQKEFTSPTGPSHVRRPSVEFVKATVFPFLAENSVRSLEIVSDYRGPRPGDDRDICRPGEAGYESEVPDDIKVEDIWIKSMNSPVWIRENGGDPDKEPGPPYPDPAAFRRWLERNMPDPDDTTVVLYGLTLDCCVLCTAQELAFRGYDVRILEEGTDTRSGSPEEKAYLLNNPPISIWASSIGWDEVEGHLL